MWLLLLTTAIRRRLNQRFVRDFVSIVGGNDPGRRRAFAVHGPMVWNSLPDDLRAQQDYESFRQGLKTWLFSRY